MVQLQLRTWRPQPAQDTVQRRAAIWLAGAAELAAADARDRAPVRTGRLRGRKISSDSMAHRWLPHRDPVPNPNPARLAPLVRSQANSPSGSPLPSFRKGEGLGEREGVQHEIRSLPPLPFEGRAQARDRTPSKRDSQGERGENQ